MYKLLLVFASAAALKRPQRALAVRGGEIDPIQIGKGIVAASGLCALSTPRAPFEKYGCKNIGKSGETLMRASALGQLVFAAAALNMDSGVVHGQISYHMLAFVLLSQPTWEFHKAPKMPDAIWMAIVGAGRLQGARRLAVEVGHHGDLPRQRRAVLPRDRQRRGHVRDEGCLQARQGDDDRAWCPDARVGTYLAALIKGKSRVSMNAYAMCVYAAAAAKFAFVEADDLNVPKAGPLAWTALSGALAYKALNWMAHSGNRTHTERR